MHFRLAIGTDHRGFALKNELIKKNMIGEHTIEWHDVGTFTPERTDYPIYAKKVVDLMHNKTVERAVLLCGSGIGMVIAADRFKGIYAGIAWNETVARAAIEDDNVNVLALPVDYIKADDVPGIINAWLSASFKNGRYAERLAMVDSF